MKRLLIGLFFFLFFIPSVFAFNFWGSFGYDVCCLLPLNGENKKLGENVLKGLLLGLDVLKGSSFSVFVYDSGGISETALYALKNMEAQNCDVLIALLGKNTAQPVISKAYKIGLPVIALTAESNIPKGKGFIYRDFITPEIQIKNLLDLVMKKLNYTSFAVFYPEDQYGKNYLRLFLLEVGKRGGSVVKIVSYPPKTTDFAIQIKSLIGKMIANKKPEEILKNPVHFPFDAVFIPDNALTSAFIISQFAYYNAKNLVFLGTALWDTPEFAKMVKGYCRAAYFPTGFTLQAKQPWVKQFINDFRKNYHAFPDYLSAQGYEVGRILLYLKNLNRLPPKNIHETIQNFPGTTGLTSFLPNGEVIKKIYIMEIKHGKCSLIP